MHNYEKLLQKIRRNEIVLWVGAGFSRYAKMPTGKEVINIIKIKTYATNRNGGSLSIELMGHFESVQRLGQTASE